MKPKPLAIEIRGEIVSSNWDETKAEIIDRIQSLVYDLRTDADFAEAEENVKGLKKVENDILTAKEYALDQARDVQALFDNLDEVSGQARDARLKLGKQIKDRKEAMRQQIVNIALDSIVGTTPNRYAAEITAAIKGKRDLAKMKEAAEEAAAEINGRIMAVRMIVTEYTEAHGEEIGHDLHKLDAMTTDEVNVEMERRVERKKIAEERAIRAKEEEERRKKDLNKLNDAVPAPVAPVETPQTTTGGDFTLNARETAEQELKRFTASARDVLWHIKPVRESLVHEENKAKVGKLVDAINAAWSAFTKGGAA